MAGTAGKGRPPGVPNKFTMAVKEMVEVALSEVGGKDYLVAQAHENPVAFLSLVKKLMPSDVNVSATVDVHSAIIELARKAGE